MFWNKGKEEKKLEEKPDVSTVKPADDQGKDEEKSIYQVISENIKDGRFPEGFEPIVERINDEYVFSPGGRDGMMIYQFGFRDIGEEEKRTLQIVLKNINKGNYLEADSGLNKYFEQREMIETIDYFQNFIIEHSDEYNADRLYRFAMWEIAASKNIECVKFGLSFLELLDIRERDEIKKVIRILSRYDEFTLFGLFCMMKWPNAEEEMLCVGRRVSGWGRIHVVNYIEPKTDETREWILKEGVLNHIGYAYSAYDCYIKCSLSERLSETMDDEEFEGTVNIMTGLLDEGPAKGISRVEDRDVLINKYIMQFNDRKVSLNAYNTVLEIFRLLDGEEDKNEILIEKCRGVLLRPDCENVVRKSLKEGEGDRLANALNIDISDDYFRLLESDFDKYSGLAIPLMREEKNVDRTVSIFEREYQKFSHDDKEFHGYGSDEVNMVFCVQELRRYPGKGVSLLKSCIHSPAIQLRNMILRVVEGWMENSGKSLLDISPELQEALLDMLETEKDEDLRLRIKGVLCNKIYKKPPLKIEDLAD